MWEVVDRVQGLDFVLKGAGALVRAYGLNRHSTDLDFGAARPTDLNRRVRRAIEAVGVVIDERSWWSPRDTGRTGVSRQLKVDFIGPNGRRQELQIDTRYKPKPKTEDIVVIEGFLTYKLAATYGQKLEAMKDRREARDVFDLAFMTDRYGDTLSDVQIRRAESITRDMDRLANKLERQIKRDKVLERITTDDDIVIRFRTAVDKQVKRRRMFIQEQRVPISFAMTKEIRELREILHGPEANVPRSSDPALTRAPDNYRSRHRQRRVDRDPGPYR